MVAACGLCTSTVHNKLSGMGIFKLLLKTGQNSDYNNVFPVVTIHDLSDYRMNPSVISVTAILFEHLHYKGLVTVLFTLQCSNRP